MASVRKRVWVSAGAEKTAWLADYFDGAGKRHVKTFKTRTAAKAWLDQTQVDVARGVHTPDSKSITVAQAGQLWLDNVRLNQREASTQRDYTNHLRLHIAPLLGAVKLSRLTTPGVEAFKDKLREKLTPVTGKKVLLCLKMLLSEAQRRGLVAQNVATGVRIELSSRDKKKLVVGVDIPAKHEIPLLLDAATGRGRALLTTAVFTGMRASELRGLRWADVDFEAGVLHVRQKADRFNEFGNLKSASADRTIPLAPPVRNALLAWKAECPFSRHDLVFPTRVGSVQDLTALYRHVYNPAQVKAGLVDADGKPKYSFHALRHFFASWLIDQNFKPKRVQALMGHSSIKITLDVYSHLFPSDDDDNEKFALGALNLIGESKPKLEVVSQPVKKIRRAVVDAVPATA